MTKQKNPKIPEERKLKIMKMYYIDRKVSILKTTVPLAFKVLFPNPVYIGIAA